MENVKFQLSANEQGKISALEIGGILILENAQQLKNELVGIIDRLSESVKITIPEGTEIDLSCIQLIVAFIKRMEDLDIDYQFLWNLEEDQKSLLLKVGLSNELFMNN